MEVTCNYTDGNSGQRARQPCCKGTRPVHYTVHKKNMCTYLEVTEVLLQTQGTCVALVGRLAGWPLVGGLTAWVATGRRARWVATGRRARWVATGRRVR